MTRVLDGYSAALIGETTPAGVAASAIMFGPAIRLHPHDNVLVATRDLPRRTAIPAEPDAICLPEPIPMGHKIALTQLAVGQAVVKYGHPIGAATDSIAPGQWVHTHNLAVGTEVPVCPRARAVPPEPARGPQRTFLGYRRPSGRVGTRNYLAIISTVNCSATVAKSIARHFEQVAMDDFPNIDGVIALTHTDGCGMPFDGMQHQLLRRVLRGMAQHPNVGASLLVGLGCEQATLDDLISGQSLLAADDVLRMLTMQDCGGVRKTVAAGIEMVAQLLPLANDVHREPTPAGEIVLATQCGGSDGSSGITANPALGVASDLVVAAGGTTILGETPEIYGAAMLLTQRARTDAIADRLIERIVWWQRHAEARGAVLDNNPSVGNKEGGLTTIWEKSLGAVAKGGSTALADVCLYAEPVTTRGLVMMDTPGYDPVSVTGMVAGGANVVAFTTGRGSCFGCPLVPTIKIATNTPMYRRMADDMDLNAGTVLEGRTVADVGQEIFEEILAVASGKKTKSEQNGAGTEEFVPWHIGPTL